jgi:hypothetical protein
MIKISISYLLNTKFVTNVWIIGDSDVINNALLTSVAGNILFYIFTTGQELVVFGENGLKLVEFGDLGRCVMTNKFLIIFQPFNRPSSIVTLLLLLLTAITLSATTAATTATGSLTGATAAFLTAIGLVTLVRAVPENMPGFSAFPTFLAVGLTWILPVIILAFGVIWSIFAFSGIFDFLLTNLMAELVRERIKDLSE